MDSIDYYNKYANIFFEDTVNLDMSYALDEFTNYLPEGASVLDLGCGSGRDSLYLLEKGFDVTMLDGSKEMCALAKIHTDLEPLNMKFDELDFDEVFDGIWACASLLHVESKDMPDIMSKIANALKINGIFYMSVKYGDFEGFINERYFTEYKVHHLKNVIHREPRFRIIDIWKSDDIRKDRTDAQWLNVLIKKIELE